MRTHVFKLPISAAPAAAGIVDKAKELGIREFEDKEKSRLANVSRPLLF